MSLQAEDLQPKGVLGVIYISLHGSSKVVLATNLGTLHGDKGTRFLWSQSIFAMYADRPS